MKQWRNILAILAISSAVVGCGKMELDKVNARPTGPKKVTQWKHSPQSAVGSPYGLIIETQGDEVSAATMYDLKDGPGFNLAKQISTGHVVSKEKGLLLPVAPPVTAMGLSASEWIANGGPYWVVQYAPTATKLVATLSTPGMEKYPIDFLPVLPSAGAPTTP